MSNSGKGDLSAVLRGLQLIFNEVVKQTGEQSARKWNNSSIQSAVKSSSQYAKTVSASDMKSPIGMNPTEAAARISTVATGIGSYLMSQRIAAEKKIRSEPSTENNIPSSNISGDILNNFDYKQNPELFSDLDVPSNLSANASIDRMGRTVSGVVETTKDNLNDAFASTRLRMESLQEQSKPTEISDEQMDAIGKKLEDLTGMEFNAQYIDTKKNVTEDAPQERKINILENIVTKKPTPITIPPPLKTVSGVKNSSTNYDPIMDPTVTELDLEKILAVEKKKTEDNIPKKVVTPKPSKTKPAPKLLGKKPLAKNAPESLLSSSSKARKVPDTRISRLMSFGGLAAGLGLGTLAEVARRSVGLSEGLAQSGALLDDSPVLTEANVNRIVSTLCKVRGAALKLGQMLSIQDNAFINPQLQQILERVRQSADFMPDWQLQRILVDEIGPNWRDEFSSFSETPFAAASIGQVHEGILHDGRMVAVKVQYPGVAEGIDSDINNLMTTLNYANILPESLFVEDIIKVAKRELGWECDYSREAQCGLRFANMVENYPNLYVPALVPQLSSKKVLTTELIDGISVDRCVDKDQQTRDFIGQTLLELTLRELFQFGYMQTDPNWANFFYNESTRQITLLDFGACREFDKSFVDTYIEIIHGAATDDREKVLRYSREIGFLTGFEAKIMTEAHIDAVMILGEAFQQNKPYAFGKQDITRKVQTLVPTMMQHRMCPPPEEIYSLHRKMSGVFLLCAKLNAVVNVNPLFFEIYNNHVFGGDWPTRGEA